MKSNALKNALEAHGVSMTHNRPYVSNDNPYSESEFRTMKYRPDYPGMFDSLEAARAHIDRYVVWYNTEHRHSGIALFTPDQVHDGTWEEVWLQRDRTLAAYHAKHPERFRTQPQAATPAGVVGINQGVPSMFYILGVYDPKKVAEASQPGGKPLPFNHSPFFAPDPEPTFKTGVQTMTLAVMNVMQ